MTEDELHEKYPDLYTKWFNRGYEVGLATGSRKTALTNEERTELIKLRKAVRSHKKLFQELRAANQSRKKVALKEYREARKKKPAYTPPADNQKIVKDSKYCVYCGAKAQTADHLIPKSRGGHDGYKNLAPACYACNQEKSNMTYNEYVTWRRHHYPELYE